MSGMLARLFACIVVAATAGAAFADESGFFGFQAGGYRQRSTLPAEQRERLLRDTHACNQPYQSPDQQQRCQELQRGARQAVLDKTIANHQVIAPQRQEMRRLYEEQSVLPR